MSIAAPKYVINRLPQSDEELYWMVVALFGVKIPRTQVCKDHVTPFQAFADAYFARSPVTIWKASRGYGGKSFTLALLATVEAALLGAESSVLGGSAAQSLNVQGHSQELWGSPNAPKYLLSQDPTKWDTWLSNGGHIRSLTASQTSVRGPHPQRLRMDEIDEMDLAILQAAQGQPMRKIRNGVPIETQTVLSSTHQYPDKTMAAMLERAKEKGWPVYQWCYKESMNPVDGWLSPDEVERKRNEIPQGMWSAEYDLQEPSFDNRAIDSELVDLAFSPVLGEFSGEQPVRIEEPREAMYVTGIDWAKSQDMTVIATYRVTSTEPVKYKCVAWQAMNRLPWSVMVGKALQQWRDYGGVLIHDATGIGNVVDDMIRDTVSHSEYRRVKPFVMKGGEHRMALFSEYTAAIERQDIISPRIEYTYREHLYVRDEDLYRSGGHPPDSIVAGALAWKVRPKMNIKPTAPVGFSKTQSWVV